MIYILYIFGILYIHGCKINISRKLLDCFFVYCDLVVKHLMK